jgi:hypothetical protein
MLSKILLSGGSYLTVRERRERCQKEARVIQSEIGNAGENSPKEMG